MSMFGRLFGKHKTEAVGSDSRTGEFDEKTIARIILASCSEYDDLPPFFKSAPPLLRKAFGSLPMDKKRNVLKTVLRELHPNLIPQDIAHFARELLHNMPADMAEQTPCASCGKQAARFGAAHVRKCSCGKMYCQLCVMNAASTPQRGKCICGRPLLVP